MIPEWCKRAEQETHKAVRTYLDEVLDFHPLQSVLDECIPVSAIIAKHAPETEPCKHPYILPNGNCVSCGVLATSLPGHVEEFHKLVIPVSRVRELVEAAREAADKNCGCHSNQPGEEGWHSRRCYIPRLRRALEPFKEVS